jgi:hypothetical protein
MKANFFRWKQNDVSRAEVPSTVVQSHAANGKANDGSKRNYSHQ